MLKLENLSYAYQKGGENALKNLDMDFSKGSCVDPSGEDGAGKSTIFLNMLGTYRSSQGKVYYQDKELSYKKKDLSDFRSKMSVVFQDPDQQIFHSNIEDDIVFALKNQKLDPDVTEDEVQKAMEAVNITHLANRSVHYLSYGQKKKAATAGILAMDCETILFDESTAGLDPSMTESIKELLASLVVRGKKFIASSHGIDFVYDAYDYVYVISHGEMVTEGSIDQVLLNEKVIQEAGPVPPILVRMHLYGRTPLFKKEKDLYSYLRERAGDHL